MAAFTINAGGTVLWDSLSAGSVNATLDTYTISNNTTLKIDTDSYQCANHSAAFGSLDTVSFTGTGGKLLIDGTAVRVIPFNTGSGTVPAIGTTISRGGVSGALLGVWADWLSEPLAAGAAMPTTGFIKVRSLNTPGGITAGALTGISASATGADVPGWIEVRGADTAQITVPRFGAVEVDGAWFDIGTTNGTRGQVIPFPTCATVAGVFPGFWIETGPGTGVFERFSSAGTLAANASISTGERGKLVWPLTTGVRIGNDGTNNVGFLPPSGCRVRIPNVILTCCTRTVSGSGPRVLPNATQATRQEFVTTSSGDIKIDKAAVHWYCNFVQAYRADVTDSAIADQLVLNEIAAPLNVSNIIVSPTQVQNFAPLSLLSCFAGGSINGARLARGTLGTSTIITANYNKGITFTDCFVYAYSNKTGTASASWSLTQNSNCSWVNSSFIGQVLVVGGSNITFTGMKFSDNFTGVTGSASGVHALSASGGATNLKIEGFSNIETDTHPYAGLFQLTACYNVTIRNIGSFASPYSMGSANQSGVVFTLAGNNDGVRVQRVYVANTRTGAWSTFNSDNNVTIETLKVDYADTTAIAALNAIMKNVSLTPAATGQVAVYGTHFRDCFTSATVGRIDILCNEPTALTAAQAVITGGAPVYNSSGQVALTAVGDQITWEMPYFAEGHNALANLAPTLTGTNTGNLTLEFQYDKGAGYNGTWLALTGANLAAAGAITPAVGVRLKVRATCATANSGNLLTQISIPTVTSSTDQNQTYPLDVITLTLTGLVSGSDIVILQAGTETPLLQVDSYAGTSYGFTYETPQNIDIAIYQPGYIPYFIRNYPLSSSNASLPIAQVADATYLV